MKQVYIAFILLHCLASSRAQLHFSPFLPDVSPSVERIVITKDSTTSYTLDKRGVRWEGMGFISGPTYDGYREGFQNESFTMNEEGQIISYNASSEINEQGGPLPGYNIDFRDYLSFTCRYEEGLLTHKEISYNTIRYQVSNRYDARNRLTEQRIERTEYIEIPVELSPEEQYRRDIMNTIPGVPDHLYKQDIIPKDPVVLPKMKESKPETGIKTRHFKVDYSYQRKTVLLSYFQDDEPLCNEVRILNRKREIKERHVFIRDSMDILAVYMEYDRMGRLTERKTMINPNNLNNERLNTFFTSVVVGPNPLQRLFNSYGYTSISMDYDKTGKLTSVSARNVHGESEKYLLSYYTRKE